MGFSGRAAALPRLVLVAFLAAAMLLGCAPAKPEPLPPPKPKRTVEWWLGHLTLEEKVGQLFWFGLKDQVLSAEAEQLIREGRTGGFVLFARQGNDAVVLRDLTSRMQALTRERDRATPGLVISVDQEGGLVQRWGAPHFAPWPGNMAIGATGSQAYAEQVAAAMADELAAIGINMNLGPVADVNNNAANPVIGVRSFGEDPQAVTRLVTAAIRGTQSKNLSAVAKHFPGHGDTDLDSHLALPRVHHAMERLDKVELVPFRAAIQANVDAIMAAHIVFPAVAADGLPATLSSDVLTGLLKGKLDFKGLVVTDAMDSMKAITANWGIEKALIMAVQAGADAVLVTESFGRHRDLQNLVVEAVRSGQISEARLNDAVRRNLELKAKRGLLPEEGAAVAAVPAQPPAPTTEAHRLLALKVGAEALTLVRNKHLPLKLKPEQEVLVLGPSYGGAATQKTDGIATALGAGIKAEHANVTELVLDRKPASTAAVREAAQKADVIVYGVYNGHKYPEHQALLKELIASGKPVIAVGMGDPYELTALPQVETYVAAYGYQVANLQGVGALLFGKTPPTGKLPVSIPNLYPLGHGLSF